MSASPEPFFPERNDAVENWLKAHRDADPTLEGKTVISDLVTDYRTRALLGVSLSDEIPGEATI